MDIRYDHLEEIVRRMRNVGFGSFGVISRILPETAHSGLTVFAPARSRLVLGMVVAEVLGNGPETVELLSSITTARPDFATPEKGTAVIFPFAVIKPDARTHSAPTYPIGLTVTRQT